MEDCGLYFAVATKSEQADEYIACLFGLLPFAEVGSLCRAVQRAKWKFNQKNFRENFLFLT
jgi:hypothetical protein